MLAEAWAGVSLVVSHEKMPEWPSLTCGVAGPTCQAPSPKAGWEAALLVQSPGPTPLVAWERHAQVLVGPCPSKAAWCHAELHGDCFPRLLKTVGHFRHVKRQPI